MEVDMLSALRNYYDTEYTNEQRGPILQARIDALSDTSYWEMWKEWCELEEASVRLEPTNGKDLYDALITLRDEQLVRDREAAEEYHEIKKSKYE